VAFGPRYRAPPGRIRLCAQLSDTGAACSSAIHIYLAQKSLPHWLISGG